MATHPAPPPLPAAPHCRWCHGPIESSELSCPRCGAPIKASGQRTKSGWVEFPQIGDMARLQVGASRCQIEGLFVPVADFNLAAGDSLYFAHHVLLWKDPQVEIQRMPIKGGLTRMMAGLPIVMTEAHGPGHIAFSRDEPGEIIALPLDPGQAVYVKEHLFLAATQNVAYDWFNSGVWFTTGNNNEREYHYPLGQFMDHFTAVNGPGLLLLHAAGNVFVRELQQGQTLLIKPTALVYADPTVGLALHIDYPRASAFSFTQIIWLHVTGPGRIAIQSAYEPVEGGNHTITGHTSRVWSRAQTTADVRQKAAARSAAIAAIGPPMDERHIQIEELVMKEMIDGHMPPAGIARIVDAATKMGLSGADVRLIINQVLMRRS